MTTTDAELWRELEQFKLDDGSPFNDDEIEALLKLIAHHDQTVEQALLDRVNKQIIGEILSTQAKSYSKKYSGLYLKGCLETLLTIASEQRKALPFPLDDYTVGYIQLPYGHVLTEKESQRLQDMFATLVIPEQPDTAGDENV